MGSLTYDFRQTPEGLVEQRVEHLELSKYLVRIVLDQTTISTWNGPVLQAISASTVLKSSLKDMTLLFKGSRAADGVLRVTDADGKASEIPVDAWPLSLPSRAAVSHAKFFDLNKGESVVLQGKPSGMQMMEADGNSQLCERIEATLEQHGKKSEAMLWYDAQGRLCAIQYKTNIGVVDYIRTKVR